jgi:hypothetical protein
MDPGPVFRWRRSSVSSSGSECVELAVIWRKSSFSGGDGECVEVCGLGAVRDSKNPEGPMLQADLDALVGAIKADQLSY